SYQLMANDCRLSEPPLLTGRRSLLTGRSLLSRFTTSLTQNQGVPPRPARSSKINLSFFKSESKLAFPRCEHRSPSGRQCSQPVCSSDPRFCGTHKPTPEH